ncbi:MAG: DUF1800 domain-containing protein [Robiginitomaculum sp.]|nr:DUF1800 domain-containing protein [Robiginitomaculum sp.]
MSILGEVSEIRRRASMLGLVLLAPLVLAACGGGGSSPEPTQPPPPPPVGQVSKEFKTESSTAQFLARATFGVTKAQIDALTGTEVSDWIKAQFDKQPILYRTRITDRLAALPGNETLRDYHLTNMFLDDVIAGDDQLRQRMVLALSEIIVVSSDGALTSFPETMAYYVDILSENAFGNYRDLLEEITYSPGMAMYLSYLRNEKGDMASGRVPDENYAREILQLFSIGLVELEMDGTPKTDGQGQQIDTYDNSDITGLAKVFTGLSLEGTNFHQLYRDCPSLRKNCPRVYQPLEMYETHHSELEKTFLGLSIPANTNGTESVQMALDEIFNHPNVAPFVSRQLIQRFVTSHPKPQYVRRVATAFESGRFTLPDGTVVGAGQRGDLKATLAAVLLDDNATRLPSQTPSDFGKIREPMLRFINLARTFGETTPDSADERRLRNMTQYLGQHPFKAKHVFNFFEPEHVAPGTQTGAAGLTIPELQIVNESSVIGYINFINQFIYDTSPTRSGDPDGGVNVDYTAQLALADDAQALVDNLDLLLTGQQLSNVTKDRIVELLAEIPVEAGSEDEDRISRVRVAVSMVMTSPGYLVQR